MNKPAPKEPSMDEILSSIRQIIADDDAGAVPRKPVAAAPQPRSFVPPPAPVEAEPEPLALSAEQILHDTAAEGMAGTGVSFSEVLGETSTEPVSLVDPDDIAFETDRDEEPLAPPPPPPAPPPVAVRPAPVAERPAPVVERPAPRPAVTVAQAAPLPDPRLTADLAEQLLEPTTQSIVKSSFARLSNMSTVGANVTIEQMMREMLRPMLKEWLDENLPAVVERIVEQEIARVSRGGR